MATKTKETTSKVVVKTESDVTLREHRKENSKGELVSSRYTGQLSSLSKDKLGTALDLDNIGEVGRSIFMGVYDDSKFEESVAKKHNCEWIRTPATEEQVDALELAVWTPMAVKKQFAAIDLEHRKVTPDDKELVSTYVVRKDKNGKPIMKWDSKARMEVESYMWTSDGAKLFKSVDLSNVYNFVIHVNSLLDLEPLFDKKQQRFIAEGGRTVDAHIGRNKMVRTLVKPQSGSKKKVICNKEFSDAELERLVNAAEEHGLLDGIEDKS